MCGFAASHLIFLWSDSLRKGRLPRVDLSIRGQEAKVTRNETRERGERAQPGKNLPCKLGTLALVHCCKETPRPGQLLEERVLIRAYSSEGKPMTTIVKNMAAERLQRSNS